MTFLLPYGILYLYCCCSCYTPVAPAEKWHEHKIMKEGKRKSGKSKRTKSVPHFTVHLDLLVVALSPFSALPHRQCDSDCSIYMPFLTNSGAYFYLALLLDVPCMLAVRCYMGGHCCVCWLSFVRWWSAGFCLTLGVACMYVLAALHCDMLMPASPQIGTVPACVCAVG